MPGSHVVYYSPTARLGGKRPLQAFTALGVVKDGDPYQFDMGSGFCPFRSRVKDERQEIGRTVARRYRAFQPPAFGV